MTEQEAIELLKGFYLNDCENGIFSPCYLCENPCDEGQKIFLAIEALEKQIPKMADNITLVYDNGHPYGYIGRCPNCGNIIEDDSNYCICDCGQKLLWEETDDE